MMAIDKDALAEYLKENLCININAQKTSDYYESYTQVTVTLSLDGEVISESYDSVYTY